MNMTTREALLADILSHPDDDLRRLVFADWLEENRDPEQAAFIRAQVAGHTGKAEFLAWGDRYLTDDPGSAHLIPHLNESGGPTVEYRRGFVAVVRCTLRQWCGAECPRCVLGIYTDDEPVCVMCNGTGRTNGIGPAIVRSHPVTRVDVTDVSFSGGVWAWDAGPLGIGSAATEDIARKRISIAALTWAKSQPVTQPDISGCVGAD